MFTRHLRFGKIAVRLSALLIFTVAFIIAATPTRAYVIESVYWKYPTPIRYYYNCNTMSSNDCNGWNNGVNAWNSAGTAVGFGFNTSYQVNMYDGYYGTSNYAGYTYPFSGSTGCNGWLRASSTQAWLNRSYTDGWGSGEVQSTSAHELGHVAGLAHNNSTTAVLMYYSE